MAEHEIVWFGKKAGHENRPESLLHPEKKNIARVLNLFPSVIFEKRNFL